MSKNYFKDKGNELLEGNYLFSQAMNFFAGIMAFLFLTLGCVPCADNDTCKVKIEIDHQSNRPDHNEHKDGCSPFCHCIGCAVFSINQFFPMPSFVMPADSKVYSSYLPGNLINYSLPVWQPPKTG